MSLFARLAIAYKALTELGLQPVTLNGLYHFGLATGHYKRTVNGRKLIGKREQESIRGGLSELFTFPPVEQLLAVMGEAGKAKVVSQAEEIVNGKVRLFGSEPVELKLSIPGKLEHWTAYETGKADLQALAEDVKFLWEPARFGWAFTLGQAYWLTGEEKYPASFWHYFELFTESNPAYLGPQWMSGQEAALRLMAFAWAGQMFAGSPASTPERRTRLAGSVVEHALRLPPTLLYARSQRNNHLLVEAASLLTAGLALPAHPQAEKWRKLGWKWLNEGLQDQIDGYGEYAQHSTNYHRLMLQVVLWAHSLARRNNLRWSHPVHEALNRSIHWLLALLDCASGEVPNLGANDGAVIFPLTVCPFHDYRPVLNAAARLFLDYDLPHGPWDDLCLWLGIPLEHRRYVQLPRYLGDQIYGQDSWAYFRTAQFTSRPSHADQLHLDLWWRGMNIARDAGTYLYNAEIPWDNSLAAAQVHNTVTVDGRDQMTRAGRFLYLDWVNAYRQGGFEADPAILQQVRGRYRNRRQGYRHTRLVTVCADGRWMIEDEILSLRYLRSLMPHRPSLYRLHWLLPDWEWKIEKREALIELRLRSPQGWVILIVKSGKLKLVEPERITLVRAGETVYGPAPVTPDPTRGWCSPTYGVKIPALSLAIESLSPDDVQFTSEFSFS
jgi:hypothetical protein